MIAPTLILTCHRLLFFFECGVLRFCCAPIRFSSRFLCCAVVADEALQHRKRTRVLGRWAVTGLVIMIDAAGWAEALAIRPAERNDLDRDHKILTNGLGQVE